MKILKMAKILVIDDEEQMCSKVKAMLILDNHQVFQAQDGVVGVQIFYQFQPDLVITDINMPNKDGLEVIMELLKYDKNIPIIAMSNCHCSAIDRSNLEIAKMLGAKEVLLKPFVFQQLQDVIESVCGFRSFI